MSKATLTFLAVVSGVLCFIAGLVSFMSDKGGNIDKLPIAFGFYFWAKGVFLVTVLADKAQKAGK